MSRVHGFVSKRPKFLPRKYGNPILPTVSHEKTFAGIDQFSLLIAEIFYIDSSWYKSPVLSQFDLTCLNTSNKPHLRELNGTPNLKGMPYAMKKYPIAEKWCEPVILCIAENAG